MQNTIKITEGQWHFYEDGRPFRWRLFHGSDDPFKPLILFCHGYKGFMDWGGFPELMRQFAAAGFHVFQFNFSLNGTGMEAPSEFTDLDAFRRNTLSREVSELLMVSHLLSLKAIPEISFNGIIAGGHSRGAFIAGAAARFIPFLQGIFSLAGVVEMRERLLKHDHAKWKAEGVVHDVNSRTGQIMELGYGLWEDFEQDSRGYFHPDWFMPEHIPLLLVHGTEDAAVSLEEARALKQKRVNGRTFLHEIAGADHTFGMKHPQESAELPAHTQELLSTCLKFFGA